MIEAVCCPSRPAKSNRSYAVNQTVTRPASRPVSIASYRRSVDVELEQVNTQDSTIANTDLWARYFQDQWSNWLNPLGVPAESPVAQVAEGTAARVAGFLTLIASGPIAWLYNSKYDVAEIRPEGLYAFEDAPEMPAEHESIEDTAA